MSSRRRLSLHARWNKDLSITLYARGKKICSYPMIVPIHTSKEDAIRGFATGWFGSENPADWRIRWTYPAAKRAA